MTNPDLMTGLGAALSIFLSSAGSCYASVPAGIYLVRRSPFLGFKAVFPIVVTGVLAIYGAIVGVILSARFGGDGVSDEDGYRNLAAGLIVGLACLASGSGMGKFLDRHLMSSEFDPPAPGGRRNSEVERPLLHEATTQPADQCNFWVFMSAIVFLEAIGLYGLIVALLVIGSK